MNHTRKSSQNPTNYLLQSRKIIEKISSRMNLMPNLTKLSPKNTLFDVPLSKPSRHHQNKTENTYQSIINNESVLPLQPIQNKQNKPPNTIRNLDVKKSTMYPTSLKHEVKDIQTQPQTNQFPEKEPSQKLPTMPLPVRTSYQKNQISTLEQKAYKKDQEFKSFFSRYVIPIRGYHIASDSEEFMAFQKINYKLWDDLVYGVKSVERFCENYEITYCCLELSKLLDMINAKNERKKATGVAVETSYTPHTVLSLLEGGELISEQNQNKKGIRFFGAKGRTRAIIKIQANVRRWLAKIKFNKVREMIQKVVLIQRLLKIRKGYNTTKKLVRQSRLAKLKQYNERQKNFKENYRQNRLTKSVKYEVHVSCHAVSEWQRLSTPRFIEKQNAEITRIFRAAKQSGMQTRIVYVSPIPIPNEIMKYYSKLFDVGGKSEFKDRIYFISPQVPLDFLDQNISLTKALWYSSRALRRIKKIIKGEYSYIVPSTPSNDYVLLSHQLAIPVYSSNCQPLLHLQSKSGCKQLVQYLQKKKENSSESKRQGQSETLPFALDIYNQNVFLSELSHLICKNPQISKWVMKIENENDTRGMAYIDTSRALSKHQLQLLKGDNPERAFTEKEKVYRQLEQSIFKNDKDIICVLDKSLYTCQKDYLNNFFTKGGIIEAAINNFQSQLLNKCVCIEIQPDLNWRVLCSYQKLTVKKKAACCYFDPENQQYPREVQDIAEFLTRKGYFGFFNLEFVSFPEISPQKTKNKSFSDIKKDILYFNGIQCSLNEYSCASFLHSFLAKDTQALYVPLVDHPSIKLLRMQTFFHLCRLQNISFDISRRIGNVFLFVDGIESGCMGMMTFNSMSKDDTFVCASEVLDFFGSKLTPSAQKSIPQSFTRVRNAINGYIKRKERKWSSKILRKLPEML